MRLVMPGWVSDARNHPGVQALLLVLAMALYLTLGAIVFQAIEGPQEEETMENINTLKMSFLNEHPCVSGNIE